jgi:hypothetical protein
LHEAEEPLGVYPYRVKSVSKACIQAKCHSTLPRFFVAPQLASWSYLFGGD